jgi:hypothetical protein
MAKQNINVTVLDMFTGEEVVNEFEDIAGYKLTADWVAVMGNDGVTTCWPSASVNKVIHFNLAE